MAVGVVSDRANLIAQTVPTAEIERLLEVGKRVPTLRPDERETLVSDALLWFPMLAREVLRLRAIEREEATTIKHRCERAGCGQLVAIEHANGDIEPVVTGVRWTPLGQLVVRCPDCQRAKMLPIRRAA